LKILLFMATAALGDASNACPAGFLNLGSADTLAAARQAEFRGDRRRGDRRANLLTGGYGLCRPARRSARLIFGLRADGHLLQPASTTDWFPPLPSAPWC